MPTPWEICLEELDRDPQDDCYVRCVALPGGEPGLGLDRAGSVSWRPDGPGVYELWVSDDDRLVLLRCEGAGPITVERSQRSVEAPVGKPVMLLDQDLLRIDGRRLRVHVHGPTEAVYTPERFGASAFARFARGAAAAATLLLAGAGAQAAGSGGASATLREPPPIEVRARPPAPRRASRTVECSITSQSVGSQALVLSASCPSPGVAVGQTGQIVDPKTKGSLAKGMVTVKSVDGTKIVVEATGLRKRVSATTIRFWIRY